jgi:hypothetical protein
MSERRFIPLSLSESDSRLMSERSWKVREVSQVFSVPTNELRFVSSRNSGPDLLLQSPALSEKGSPSE